MSAIAKKSPSRQRARAYTTAAKKWQAVLQHDPQADGHFFYSVKTTGIYCRPSCASRTPLRENVAFHTSSQAAERAGFRPCKRCQPNGPGLSAHHAKLVIQACRLLETAEKAPALRELASTVGLSPFHFQRIFTRMTGLSPKAYATAHRAERLRHKLSRSVSVTDAIYDAGYSSNGRFYATATKTLGLPPQTFRQGGRGANIRFAVAPCSLGQVLVAATGQGICAIFLGDDPAALARDLPARFPQAQLFPADRAFQKTVARVVALVENPRLSLQLPLDIRGTAFQQCVWRALTEIPPGQTASYSEIARRIGRPKAVRAVGSACGANPIAVIIPCHRVVHAGGAITGYRWGTSRKHALLQKEKAGT